MNRRDFLKAAAVTAVAVALPTTTVASTRPLLTWAYVWEYIDNFVKDTGCRVKELLLHDADIRNLVLEHSMTRGLRAFNDPVVNHKLVQAFLKIHAIKLVRLPATDHTVICVHGRAYES